VGLVQGVEEHPLQPLTRHVGEFRLDPSAQRLAQLFQVLQPLMGRQFVVDR
jgi:hypothetical protein